MLVRGLKGCLPGAVLKKWFSKKKNQENVGVTLE